MAIHDYGTLETALTAALTTIFEDLSEKTAAEKAASVAGAIKTALSDTDVGQAASDTLGMTQLHWVRLNVVDGWTNVYMLQYAANASMGAGGSDMRMPAAGKFLGYIVYCGGTITAGTILFRFVHNAGWLSTAHELTVDSLSFPGSVAKWFSTPVDVAQDDLLNNRLTSAGLLPSGSLDVKVVAWFRFD